jgi:hypothetical protein
LELKKF